MVLNRNHHKVNIFTVIQVTKFSFFKYVSASQYISSLVLALGMAMSVHQTTLVRTEMSRVDCHEIWPRHSWSSDISLSPQDKKR